MPNLGVVQGFVGNPFGSAVEGPAFGVVNEVLGTYRSKDGIARPARYEVVISPPKGSPNNPFSSSLTKDVREVSLKCENISFPGRNIDTVTDTNIYGPTREIASGFSFAELNGRFQCSSDMREKQFFETWQKASFDAQKWSMNYYSEYTGFLEIYLLDEQDNRRYGVKVWDCFPKTLSPQTLDYGTINEQMKIDVGFSYHYWTNLNTEATLPQPLNDRITEVVTNSVRNQFFSRLPAIYQKGVSLFR